MLGEASILRSTAVEDEFRERTWSAAHAGSESPALDARAHVECELELHPMGTKTNDLQSGSASHIERHRETEDRGVGNPGRYAIDGDTKDTRAKIARDTIFNHPFLLLTFSFFQIGVNSNVIMNVEELPRFPFFCCALYHTNLELFLILLSA
jgi:hypothetical protein